MRTLGVLIAGGAGTRLGTPKALVPVGGETLLTRTRREIGAVCDEVVVVVPRVFAAPVAEAERVDDAIDGAGPLAALVAGLEARSFERALVLAVDQPRLDAPRLAALLEAHAGDTALVPRIAGRLQPLAAVYGPAAAAALRRALDTGARALVPAVEALAPRTLDEAALAALGLDAGDFADIDTPADRAAFEASEASDLGRPA